MIGGKAMEYYGLRKGGDEIDLVVVKDDLEKLVKHYPTHLKDLKGDFGIAVFGFEIWKTIDYFDYYSLSQDAKEESNYLVISLEKLLFQKAMAMKKPKQHRDLERIVHKIIEMQERRWDAIQKENEEIVAGVSHVGFVQKIERE